MNFMVVVCLSLIFCGGEGFMGKGRKFLYLVPEGQSLSSLRVYEYFSGRVLGYLGEDLCDDSFLLTVESSSEREEVLRALFLAFRSHHLRNYVLEQEVVSSLLLRISQAVYEEFTANKWMMCNKQRVYEWKENFDIEHLYNMGESLKRIVGLIEERKIDPGKNIPFLKKLAEKAPIFYTYLGDVYAYGHGTAVCERSATHYYQEGITHSIAGCHTGLGKIYEKRGEDSLARDQYEEGFRRGSVEAQFHLFLLDQKTNAEDPLSLTHLYVSANQRYLPAVHVLGLYDHAKKDYKSSIQNFLMVGAFHPVMREMEERSRDLYHRGKFMPALMLEMLMVEAGNTHSVHNVIHILNRMGGYEKGVYRNIKEMILRGKRKEEGLGEFSKEKNEISNNNGDKEKINALTDTVPASVSSSASEDARSTPGDYRKGVTTRNSAVITLLKKYVILFLNNGNKDYLHLLGRLYRDKYFNWDGVLDGEYIFFLCGANNGDAECSFELCLYYLRKGMYFKFFSAVESFYMENSSVYLAVVYLILKCAISLVDFTVKKVIISIAVIIVVAYWMKRKGRN